MRKRITHKEADQLKYLPIEYWEKMIQKKDNKDYVYVWKNTINNKRYVGITQHLRKRFFTHKSNNRETILNHAIKKYGQEHFLMAILLVYDREHAYKMEKFLIKKWNTCSKKGGYNLTDGGEINYSHSKETKERMSLEFSGENNPFYGKRHSKETKRKISISLKRKYTNGYVISEETRKKISEKQAGKNNSMYGKKHTEETKRKISASLKGKYTGKNNSMYGKKHTEATKRKMSKTMKNIKNNEQYYKRNQK